MQQSDVSEMKSGDMLTGTCSVTVGFCSHLLSVLLELYSEQEKQHIYEHDICLEVVLDKKGKKCP